MVYKIYNLDIDTFWGKFLDYLINRGVLYAIFIISGYLLIGTTFYAYYDEFGWIGGFNYSVAIVTLIGWTTDLTEKGDWSYLFTTLYIFAGLLLLTGLFIFIAHLQRIHPTPWYIDRSLRIQRHKELDTLGNTWQGTFEQIRVFVVDNDSAFISWTILIIYAIAGVIMFAYIFDIDALRSIYFVMSTLTTAGLYSPYTKGDTVLFLLMSIYMLVGVIAGGIALVYISESMVRALKYVRVDRHFELPLTNLEFDALKQMTITSEGKPMSRQEYLIMMAIRMELIDEEFINYVLAEYERDPPTIQCSSSSITSNPIQPSSLESGEDVKLLG